MFSTFTDSLLFVPAREGISSRPAGRLSLSLMILVYPAFFKKYNAGIGICYNPEA